MRTLGLIGPPAQLLRQDQGVSHKLRDSLSRAIGFLLQDTDLLICDMTSGSGLLAAPIAIRAGIPLVAVLPFRGHDTKWPPAAQSLLRYCLKRAAQVAAVSPDQTAAYYKSKEYVLSNSTVGAVIQPALMPTGRGAGDFIVAKDRIVSPEVIERLHYIVGFSPQTLEAVVWAAPSYTRLVSVEQAGIEILNGWQPVWPPGPGSRE